MNHGQKTPEPTPAAASAASLKRIRRQMPHKTPTEEILGVKLGEQPSPAVPRIMVPNSIHGKHKQRRSYEFPGQTTAGLSLGLSSPW